MAKKMVYTPATDDPDIMEPVQVKLASPSASGMTLKIVLPGTSQIVTRSGVPFGPDGRAGSWRYVDMAKEQSVEVVEHPSTSAVAQEGASIESVSTLSESPSATESAEAHESTPPEPPAAA